MEHGAMTVKTKTIPRYLHAKRVRFKDRTKTTVRKYPAIDVLLLEIMARAPNWTLRHYPKYSGPGSIDPGTHCVYLDSVKARPHGDKKGVYFEICAYDLQRVHDVATLDPTAPSPPTEQTTLPLNGTNERAIKATVRGVALGEIVILELPRGTGGHQYAEKLIGRLIQQFCLRPPPLPNEKPPASPNWPSIELMDVVSNDLKADILRGGGVTKISLRVASGDDVEEDTYTHRLRDARSEFANAAIFHGIWQAKDDILETEAIVDVANETLDAGNGMELVTIELASGAKIKSIGKYKARKQIDVKTDAAGPYASDVIEGLWDYLDELRVLDSKTWRLIDDNGIFTSAGTVEVPVKS